MKPLSLTLVASVCLAAIVSAQEPTHPAADYEVQDPYAMPDGAYQTIPDETGYRFRITRVDSATLNDIVSAWTGKPRELAEALIERYGEPNEAEEGFLIWHDNGIWRMTMLENIQPTSDFPDSDSGILYQSIDYIVPMDRNMNLSSLPSRVILDSAAGTLGARSDSEAENILAINLADDVIQGRRTSQEARDYQARTVDAIRSGALDDEQRVYTSGFTEKVSSHRKRQRDARFDTMTDPDYGPSIAYPNGRMPVPDYSKPYDPDEDEELKAKKAEQKEKCKKHRHLSRHWDMDWEYCPHHSSDW